MGLQQECRTVAGRPRDAAAVCFGLKSLPPIDSLYMSLFIVTSVLNIVLDGTFYRIFGCTDPCDIRVIRSMFNLTDVNNYSSRSL